MRRIVFYGKYYTTSELFIHMIHYLIAKRASEVSHVRFTLVLDDERDVEKARQMLPPGKVEVVSQYLDWSWEKLSAAPAQETVERWEQAYGDPHLRAYINGERILRYWPVERRWQYLYGHISFFERFFSEEAPVLFVSGAASVLASWVSINVARANNIRCLILSPGRFGDLCFLPVDAHEHLGITELAQSKLEQGLTANEEKQADALIEQYNRRPVKPTEFWLVKQTTKTQLIPRFSKIAAAFRHAGRSDAYWYDEPLKDVLIRAVKARRSAFYTFRLGKFVLRQLPQEVAYFFFPLQFEPEMSLSTQGRGWLDQLALITRVSESLPIDRWLYVKEHPMMPGGVRPWNFYQQLMRLPRVRLLDQVMDSHAVVRQAEAVITLGSTAGWEALMLGKPVLLVGRAFYEEFDQGVFRLESLEALPGLLRSFRAKPISREALKAFVSAVLERARPGVLTDPKHFPESAAQVLGERNLGYLADIFMEHLQCTDEPAATAAAER